MATLTLSIPNDLLRRAKARLGKKGHADIKGYLLSALEALTLDGKPIDAKTEARLLEGLDSPPVEVTDDYWPQKLRRYEARHRKAKRS